MLIITHIFEQHTGCATILAITPDAVPLGILHQHGWARDAATFGDLPDHHPRPFADTESYRWVRGLAAINAARTACPTTQFVMVADAEAAIDDLLVAARHAGVELLIRAGQNRRVRHPDARHLWDALPRGTRGGTRTVRIAARDGKPGREAHVTIRYQERCIQPPNHRATEELAPVTRWAVWVVEAHPPAGAEAIEWLLLTSVPVRTNLGALTILDW